MKSLLRVLFLAALMMPLASCGGEEPDSAEDAADGAAAAVEEATETSAATATDAMDAVAEKICCGGSCDAPAGFCHAADGTCDGNHKKLPVAP
jgi:hypothetical protein